MNIPVPGSSNGHASYPIIAATATALPPHRITRDDVKYYFGRVFDVPERRVATPARPEAVGVDAEPLLVVRLEELADDILNHLVGPGRDAERPRLAVRLGDLRPAYRRPPILTGLQ